MHKITLTNVGKHQLPKLDKNTPIISIRDKYSQGAEIPNQKNRRVLYLCFFAADHMGSVKDEDMLTKQEVNDIVNFINAVKNDGGDKIYVQCGEGRIRSYTIAHILYEYVGLREYYPDIFKDIDLCYSNEESNIKSGIIDRTTARLLVGYLKELNKEHLEMQGHE